MKLIDWSASPRAIAGRMLLLALLGGVVLGGIAGGFLVWGIGHS